jgi:ATP-dependent Lon protease
LTKTTKKRPKAKRKVGREKTAREKLRPGRARKTAAVGRKSPGKKASQASKTRGRKPSKPRRKRTRKVAGRAEPSQPVETPRLPSELGIIPLRDTVIFPYMIAPLVIGRSKSLHLVDEAANTDRMVGLATQIKPDIEDPGTADLSAVGTAATILKFPDGSTRVLVQGSSRIKLVSFSQENPYFRAQIEPVPELADTSVETQALLRSVSDIFGRIVGLSPHLPDELQVAVMNIDNASRAADLIASNINLSTPEKQEMLETFETKARLQKLIGFLNRELQVLELGSKIQSQVKTELDKSQREYYLREQLKAIRRELGETDERTIEIEELREKIESAKMSKEALAAAEKELDRLSKMPPQAAEYTVSRTYLDWLICLPWSKSTRDVVDVAKAKEILDTDHYDLDKVKERILEYLAVRKLKADMKGPILCFVGPPGVGKTSLGRSIARALGRKFTRISLGGIRDEAEIRGHRRTYVGALPGRIVQGVRKAGSNNPLFMLDEVDKIGADFRGDPSAALMEVLDPEQNSEFSDHYLEVPFDLSRVMFITTANVLVTVPPALLDRMEVIEIPGYTDDEKVEIAEQYLIPRQLEAHGLNNENLVFDEAAVRLLISEYTREAGLRNLEREIGNIARKIARKVAEGVSTRTRIKKDTVVDFLGPRKYYREVAERTMLPGVATGLAWTEAGGDIIFVESSTMKGGKNLMLTGRLGDVMRESAQAALTYVRAKAEELKIDPRFYEELDIHIHVPHGGVPKDGPSAGVTIATSLVSLLIGKPVRADVAMTGEITLKGKVLPVGGIKEKILAARRAGIRKVILPRLNEKDLVEVPDVVKAGMKFIFVDNLADVFKNSLE